MPNIIPFTASKLHSVLKLRHERLQIFNLPFFFQANRMVLKSNGGWVIIVQNSSQYARSWKLGKITGIFSSLSRGMLGHVSRSTNPVQTKIFDGLISDVISKYIAWKAHVCLISSSDSKTECRNKGIDSKRQSLMTVAVTFLQRRQGPRSRAHRWWTVWRVWSEVLRSCCGEKDKYRLQPKDP